MGKTTWFFGTCKQCGKQIWQVPSKPRNFCNWYCFGKSKRKKRTKKSCKQCHKTMWLPQWDIRRKFCSLKCKGLGSRGIAINTQKRGPVLSEEAVNEIFLENVVKLKTGKRCWIWIGPCFKKSGYGKYHYEYTHRFSWKLHVGPIPKGKFVLHKCDNPPCIRPEHLFLGTQADNNKDMFAKGRNHNQYC